eukprot:Plantae.Rhodophyta-Hildenbrandia_rubra.ctg6830.p1 GENE.Plantae.Rhodophyta-Hildenbrandia_rubra.ctg6830~~Plantae.Rhodophyta-Hildenbrandia_rubra.ctg6830.p1  ORF type:complete len:115 (+),score=11.91 Plantae.Rhodophyta-Hildenbrandia_rubra.ctg6830:1129-1473(+)
MSYVTKGSSTNRRHKSKAITTLTKPYSFSKQQQPVHAFNSLESAMSFCDALPINVPRVDKKKSKLDIIIIYSFRDASSYEPPSLMSIWESSDASGARPLAFEIRRLLSSITDFP